MDINKEKDGGIKDYELRYWCNFWGIYVSEKNLSHLFSLLDADGDGKITYGDFVKTVGSEIHPGEGLYFR